MPSRLAIALKSLRQLGLRPLALFALYRLGLLTGHYARTSRTRASNIELSKIVPIFSFPSTEQLKTILGDDGQRALLREADEIVDGKIRLFGAEPVPLELTFDAPLQHWTAYEKHPGLLSSLRPPATDIKFIWEPARFGWAFVLGRAYRVTQDEKYAQTFWKYFEQFTDGNPPYLGPHWMNGQEAAIRLMAMAWAGQVFSESRHSTPEGLGSLAFSLAHHAARIAQTLIYARAQNNNHLVTEAAALFTAGVALGRPRWRALGWRWLNWAFRHQIGDYGEYIQHSTNYHRLMLQIALWVTSILNTLGDSWPAVTSQALARSAHWLFSVLDSVSGNVPNLGANDGAQILPMSTAPIGDFRPTVQAAARAFLRSQLPSGPWDELSAWLGFGPAAKTRQSDDYLIDNLRGNTSWAYLRASRFKSRLSHMDQLHLDLWWRGLNVARDAGTYEYNAPPPWDNPLVSTRVHNTVTVDGRDQMMRGGRFLSLDWFHAYSKPLIDPDINVLQKAIAYHTGYRGVRHERVVTVYADERWLVEDKLLARRPHIYRLHWLLPDWEWKVENAGERLAIDVRSPHGWIRLTLGTTPLISALHTLLSVVRAGEQIHGSAEPRPFEGWFSPTYGLKIPALSFAVEVPASGNVTFATEFRFPT